MTQSRLWSLYEAKANVLVGFGINWIANLVILPLYGFPVSGTQAASMGLLYTGISLARSYALRRVFNGVGR